MARETVKADTHTAAQALIGAGLEAALEGRRKAWFGELDGALSGLAERVEGFNPGRLVEDAEFVSVVAVTTRLALETHGVAKLDALRNIVLNTAAGITVDDPTRRRLMIFVDRFSDLHFRILAALRDPRSVPEVRALGETITGQLVEQVLGGAFHAVATHDVLKAVIADLVEAQLVVNLKHAKMTKEGMMANCISTLGASLLRLVDPPAALH